MGKCFLQDMREIKPSEDLIQSERLAATGQAAAGSATYQEHPRRLPGGAHIFKQGDAGDEQKMDLGWEMIGRNAEIISDPVKDLLNFSKARSQYELSDPATLIRDVATASGLGGAGHSRIRTPTTWGSRWSWTGARFTSVSESAPQCGRGDTFRPGRRSRSA